MIVLPPRWRMRPPCPSWLDRKMTRLDGGGRQVGVGDQAATPRAGWGSHEQGG
jgi:hypothetical protein